jgi:ABC-2 type transport system ATP-binding protein
VQASDGDALLGALTAAGLAASPNGAAGAFVVDAEPEAVGLAARDGGIALTRLGPLETAGLEELFFDLTSGSDA